MQLNASGSMHPCLYVDEIVRLIADELVQAKEQASSVTLACCCKSFADPMLDVLWESQDQLLPLMKSLLGDAWHGHGCTASVSTMRIFPSLNYLV